MKRSLSVVCLIAAALYGPGPLSAAPSESADTGVDQPVRTVDSRSTDTVAAPDQTAPGALTTYSLEAHWSRATWSLRPGHYGDATDISSGPDGETFVLDGYHDAVHVLDAGGIATRVFPLNPYAAVWAPAIAIDVGFDGTLHVLRTRQSRRDGESRVELFAADGSMLSAWSAYFPYQDIAVRRDGRVYLTSSGALPGSSPTLDVYTSTGVYLETISFPELAAPIAVDVGADDEIYVLQEVPPPPTDQPPGPLPTPGPSNQPSPADPVAGVVLISPEHLYRETVAFEFGLDVAVGAAGVFVARYGDILPLRAIDPLTPPTERTWTGELRLDVAADGHVSGALSHCAFQGVVTYAAPVTTPSQATLAGVLDKPPLEGPVHAVRVSADSDASVLQARYRVTGQRPDHAYDTASSEAPTVQLWSLAGSLDGQLGICLTGSPNGARDLASADGEVVLIDSSCVEFRPTGGFPAWNQCLGGVWADATTHLTSVAFDGGTIAVLDGGGGGVVLMDRAGNVTGQWRIVDAGATSPFADIALGAGMVALADRGRSRVLMYAPDGRKLGEFPTHDGPRSLDIAPDGSILVLGAGGWGLAYDQSGTLRAAWDMPNPAAEPTDISADRTGRVLVSYVDYGPRPEFPLPAIRPILGSGVWVFAPSSLPPVRVPSTSGCTAAPDKTARPARLPLGSLVDVTLTTSGACPGDPVPVQIALVMDTSRSMNWGYAFDSAKALTLALLRGLDPAQHEVALVTFDDDAALRTAFTRDLLAVSGQVAALRTGADTRMASGLEASLLLFDQPPPAPDAKRIIFLVSDGVPSDDVTGLLAQAQSDGVEVHALLIESGQMSDPVFVDGLMGSRVLRGVSEIDIAQYSAELLSPRRTEPGLFREITITDEMPDNMTFIPGSDQPRATVSGRTLSWHLTDVQAAAGVNLTYKVRPQEAGVWPTNVRADAAYTDAHGAPGTLVYPVPVVEVVAGTQHIYLPLLTKESCLRRERPADVVLVVDTSVSMSEPAVGGGTKLDAARAAAGDFLRMLRLPSDWAAIISFNETGTVEAALTGDLGALQGALDRLASSPGTRIDAGLDAAASALEARRPEARPAIVLLSDGRHGASADDVVARAEALRNQGVLIYAIALGADADVDLLGQVAGAPARLFVSADEAALLSIYAEVSERLACDVR